MFFKVNIIFVFINNLDEEESEVLENEMKMAETTETICQEDEEFSELISVSKCDEEFSLDLGDINTIGSGHLLNVKFMLKNVCPNSRYAVLISVFEIDPKMNKKYRRGKKFFTVTIPEFVLPCSNVIVDCVHFILPDDVAVEDFCYDECDDRQFEISIISHILD